MPALAQTVEKTRVEPATIVQHSELVPLYVEDVSLGDFGAPVTLVAFLDLECPYCAQAWETLERLRHRYAENQLRVVVKQLPLSFHEHAERAARQLLEAQRQYGNLAAAAWLTCVFAQQPELKHQALQSCSAVSAASPVASRATSSRLTVEQQTERDQLLARRLGIVGTPAFRINGIALEGALPDAEFERVIESELREAQKAVATGTPPGVIYAQRVAQNHMPSKPAEAEFAEPDPTRWAVLPGNSPALGPTTAPVTIVAFMDYECPYCQRGYATLQRLRAKYPTQLRLVWKHRPLEFHEHAQVASQLALEVRRQKGDDAFWTASGQLFERQSNLTSDTLAELATSFELDKKLWRQHLQRGDLEAALVADTDQADDFSVDSTPQFFVNGLRIKGTRLVEDFSALIERELLRADQLRAIGGSNEGLMARIMADAIPAPPAPRIDDAIQLPAGPSLGPAKASVTIHAFSDFECPYCQRAHATIRSLLARYPNAVRLVWHDLPLGMHARARDAATLAREIREQRGDEAFFRVADILFENQADLSEAALTKYASAVGVNRDSLEQARRERNHGAAVDRDRALAESLHITSTPTFVVGRYLLEGAQPIRRFERLIRRTTADRRAAKPTTGTR